MKMFKHGRAGTPGGKQKEANAPHQSPVAQRVDWDHLRVMPRHLSRLFATIAKRLSTFLGTVLSRKGQEKPRGPALSGWQY